MNTAAKLGKPAVHAVTPHLVVRGAAEAILFYKKAFGAIEIRKSMSPDGHKVMFAELEIGTGRVYLNDEFPDWGVHSPLEMKGTAVTMHLSLNEADPIYEQALAAGCKAVMELADQFWGDRYAIVEDPFGHRWSIGAPVGKN
jgi:PhnB protein